MTEKIYLDTNIFLSVVLGDEDTQAAKKILEASGSSYITYSSTIVINEILFLLEKRGYSSDEMRIGLDFVLSHSDVLFLSPAGETYRNAVKIKRSGIAIADALHVALMKEANIKYIGSFDPDFDKIKEIKRISAI